MFDATTEPLLRPPLKWAGGKRWLAPRLRELYAPHRHRRLVEPFCGGLAVALGLCPARALLNDVNEHLINFYRWIANGFVIHLDMRNEERLYYRHRDRFNDLVALGQSDTCEAAGLFYYLNRTGFNGLCRFNRQGFFNVPFGRFKAIRYTEDFRDFVDLFAQWQFTCSDFESVALEPGDFVYADPPYDASFSGYAKEGFRWEDHVRLAEWLSRHPGPVVLSNRATPRIETLYLLCGFRITFVDAPRRINANGDRALVREILAVRNL